MQNLNLLCVVVVRCGGGDWALQHSEVDAEHRVREPGVPYTNATL